MTSAENSPAGKNESFLFDDLIDCRSQKQKTFERAAIITPLVKCVTIGPNSSFSHERSSSPPPASIKTTPEPTKQRKIIPTTKTSPVTSDDVRILQHKLQQEAEDKKVKEQVRRMMEVRNQKEQKYYDNIQLNLDARKREAEKRHEEKVEALQKQIEAALKIVAQEEETYQKRREDLAKNTRKILEQQERDLRENLRRLDEHFEKLEAGFEESMKFSKVENSILSEFRKSLEEIKAQRNSNRSSIDVMKKLCFKVDDLRTNFIKVSKEFEAKQAQKEAEMAAAAALAESQAQEARKAADAAAAAVAAQAAIQKPAPIQKIPSTNSETGRKFIELMQLLVDKQNSTRQLSEMTELQNLRFALKMAVNGPINLLNEQNRHTLVEGLQKLTDLLSGQRVMTNKGAVSIGDHPEAADWTKLRLAEKLIDVCDKKPETIFFVAALSLALWQKFPDFGSIFLGKLYKECPFLVPFKASQIKGQSDEEFLKSWGYRVADGVAEKYEHYQLRTSRFANLLAALWISFPRQSEKSPHPMSISHGWEYLINVMNSPADPMYLHIIDKIIEISGSTMQISFGKQFSKLILVVQRQYLPSLQGRVDESMKAALDRLDVTIKNYFNESRFPPPKGKLNPNFW